MKKNLFLFALTIFTASTLFAKKVKFAVDMTGIPTSSLGIHVNGDFQVAAGYPLDWDPASTTLTQEGSTNIYSIIVNIPAFTKYEYRFINGDQSYEAEAVPNESRVDLFDDNRWIYVDSLSNDTMFVGAIQFGQNAPAGKYLIRYKVDVSLLATAPFGVHVATTQNNFNPFKTRMYSFANNIYEIINYLPFASGVNNYNFINGKTLSDIEVSVPNACATMGTRNVNMVKDTVLSVVCFNYCTECNVVSIKENIKQNSLFNLFPNPVTNTLNIQSQNNEKIKQVNIYDATGKLIKSILNINDSKITLSDLNLNSGMYSIAITNMDNNEHHLKFIVK